MGALDGSNVIPSGLDSMLECVSSDSLGGISGDQFDGLHDARLDFVLNTRVLSFGILTDEQRIYVIVCSLEARDGFTRSHVCEKTESNTKSKIE